MRRILRYFLICMILIMLPVTMVGQTTQYHKVQKKETMYGISRMYGITVEQLVQANPGMEQPGYKLKKGDIILIPSSQVTSSTSSSQPGFDADVTVRAIRVGVMLPLHNINNDGTRMVEYYRGLLMACDSLKKEGISIDIRAWNLPETADITPILEDPTAARCDIIFGPLYSRFVPELSAFVKKHHIKLVIPFSINAPEVLTNPNIFQIYQHPDDVALSSARRCAEWFKGYHPVIVDCNDPSSTKGAFTTAYRRQLEERGIRYNLTSLQSADSQFAAAFVKGQPNLVVLNTSRSPELLAVFGRLSAIRAANPDVQISMFGYTEWMMYTQYQQDNFFKYNVYIPAPFYTNFQSWYTERFQQSYRSNFHQDMLTALPRFALTGYDHAFFFLRGLHKYGKAFDGASGRVDYQPLQTPLKFDRLPNGGFLNHAFMFIHYKDDRSIESVNY